MSETKRPAASGGISSEEDALKRKRKVAAALSTIADGIAVKKPEWLRKPSIVDPNQELVAGLLKELNLNTVCHEACCPNHAECFAKKTATFMILGTRCTRDCRFCSVSHAAPQPADPEEPERIARAAARLGLRYVVVTSVTRDDLPDGGAAHFAEVIQRIRALNPETAVETLIPDFQGNREALETVAAANPAVISHNMETVSALYPAVRPQAVYQRSLALLAGIRRANPAVHSKTGVMLGLGETRAQVLALFDDLRQAGCEFLTIGQYLAPSRKHHPVIEYIPPDQFAEYGEIARNAGFAFVASAPFVRSSYHASEALGL
jgi:lipoic acid synthetase